MVDLVPPKLPSHTRKQKNEGKNGQLDAPLHWETKNDIIWLKFKDRPVGRCPDSLDRTGSNFKCIHTHSKQFGRFFGQKFLIGHLPGHFLLENWLISTMDESSIKRIFGAPNYWKMSQFSIKKCPAKCPIRNFWPKNLGNGFEWFWMRLKLLAGRYKLPGHRPADPDRSLNLSHMKSIFRFSL